MDGSQQPITKINLKLLQTFMLVANNSSFREAADRTHRSQSAVSTQIKQLETQLGLRLFHRTTRKVKLTPEGEQLLLSAQRAMQELSLGLRKIQEAVDMQQGRVSLGCSPTIAATHLPRILAAFERDYPGVRMILRELKSAELYENIRRGEVDFGVGPIIEDDDLDFDTILIDRLFALVPRHLVGDARTTITLAELSALPILQFHTATVMGKIIEEAARARNVTLNVRYQCIQAQTLVVMAEAGLGATIMTESVVQMAHAPSTRKMRIVEPAMSQEFGIIKRRGQALSPAAHRLGQLIKELMRPAAADRPIRSSRKSK